MSLRVVLVDDSLADQRALQRALEKDPETRWEVEVLGTAEEALERLHRPPLPDALVLSAEKLFHVAPCHAARAWTTRRAKLLVRLVGAAGFEPATARV